jgi:uncharacterized iron-regulated membrane protein
MTYLIIFLLWVIAGLIWSFVFGSIAKVGEHGLRSSSGPSRDVSSEAHLEARNKATAGV